MDFDMNEYQVKAQRTSATHTEEDKLINGGMGLAGECGEVCDLVKKYAFQGHALNRKKLAEELGDVLWYCAELAEGLGVDLADVAQQNIEKLYDRYPNGFEALRSRERGMHGLLWDNEGEEGAEAENRERGAHGLRRGRTRKAGSPEGFLEAEAVAPETHGEKKRGSHRQRRRGSGLDGRTGG